MVPGGIGSDVLLFQKRFHQGLVDGSVTLTFRAWATPRVKVGGRYRVHPIGVVQVDDVRPVRLGDVTEADALAAGFTSLAEMWAYVQPVVAKKLSAQTPLFRVALHHGGDGDRVEGALDDRLTADDVATLRVKLASLDARADEPWTFEVLRLIAKRPRVAASQLAKRLGRPTLPFKVDVRKLKRLGLTQSFEVGYELSPKGRAFLSLAKRRVKARATSRKARPRAGGK